jgi:hypothetical protein
VQVRHPMMPFSATRHGVDRGGQGHGWAGHEIGVSGGGTCSGGRVGDGHPGVQATCSERPDDRARKRRLAAEEAGRARDVEMDALGQRWLGRRRRGGACGHLEATRGGKPATPAGHLHEGGPIGRRIVVIDDGHVTGAGAVGKREHGHRFGQRHARWDVRAATAARAAPPGRAARRQRPGP